MVVFKRSLGPKGSSTGISIPENVLSWMNAKTGDTINILPLETSEHSFGKKCLIIWKEK